jgi:hypothetical protein
LVARQFPGHCHSMPSRGLHEIEFFSDLVSNAIAIIGQVKEIARHGLDQCRCRTHVPNSASRPRKAPRPAAVESTARDLPRPAGRLVMAKTILSKERVVGSCEVASIVAPFYLVRMLQRTLPAGFIAPRLLRHAYGCPKNCTHCYHSIRRIIQTRGYSARTHG